MHKFTKTLAYVAFACGVALSWADTAVDGASVQDRLTQSLNNTGESERPRDLPADKKPATPQEKPSLVRQATQYFNDFILPGFSEIPKNLRGDGDGDGNGDGASGGGFWDGWGNGSGGGSGNGASANGAGSAGGKLFMDESAQADSGSDGSGDGAGDGPKPVAPPVTQSSGGGGAVKGTGRALSKWWPMCAFVDQSVPDGQANQIMKELVDDAAKCDVHIQVFAVKTDWTQIGDDYEKINNLTRKKCDLPNGLQGSATALVPWDLTAARMCNSKLNQGNLDDPNEFNDYDPGVAGCAELSSKSDQDPSKLNDADGHGHNKSSDNVAVSIEVKKGWTADIVAHEAIGHSQMGKPNGERHGMGIGEYEDMHPKDPNKPPGDDSNTGGWTGLGCGVMRDNAHENTPSDVAKYFGSAQKFLYDPNQQSYMIPSGRLYNMASDPGLFEKRKAVPLPGPMLAQQTPPASQGITRAQKPAGGKSSIDPAEDVFASTNAGVPEIEGALPEKHKEGAKIPEINSMASFRASRIRTPSNAQPEPTDTVQVPANLPTNGPGYSKSGKLTWAGADSDYLGGSGNSRSNNSGSSGKYDESVYADMFAGGNAPKGSSNSGGKIFSDPSAPINPGVLGGAGSGGSQSVSLGNGSAGPVGGSVDFNSIGAAGFGAAGATPGFDNKVFNVGETESEEADDKSGASRLRRQREARDENPSGLRRPASRENGSSLIRVNKPAYGGGDL
jgi:hypothetical protein